jgi:hypothetical protein
MSSLAIDDSYSAAKNVALTVRVLHTAQRKHVTEHHCFPEVGALSR